MARHTIIVVGTSAGGVEALCELNKDLPNVGESPNRRARSQAVARNSGADLADTPRNARTPVRAEPFGAACRGLPALTSHRSPKMLCTILGESFAKPNDTLPNSARMFEHRGPVVAPLLLQFQMLASRPTANVYEAVADLTLAIRSSMRSRSTSQYLSADRRSLSG
jgi:hypothetical protein